MRNNPEYAFHATVAGYLRVALPSDVFWTTIGHGGGGAIRGAMLKNAGLRAGVPDVFILYRGKAIFFELKAQSGRLSEAQKEVHDLIVLSGGVVTTVTTLEQIDEFLRVLGIEPRVKLNGGKLYDSMGFKVATGAQKRVYVPNKPRGSKKAMKTAKLMWMP